MSTPSEYLASLYSLTGKVAVVIGGTGELCGAMAEGLAGAGAEVVLVGRNEEKARPRLERITQAGGKGYFVSAEASEKAPVGGWEQVTSRRGMGVGPSAGVPVAPQVVGGWVI